MKVFKPDDGIASIEKNIPDAMTKDRATLLEQAQSFLDDQTIRNSSDEKKMAFLQSKGLRVEEAEKLLSSIGEAKPASSAREEDIASENPVQSSDIAQASEPIILDATPPIITYPEFLLHARKQQPILTTSRILGTLYASSFVAAVIYGANTYVLTPMLDSLTEARHDFFESTISNLENLNKKLEDAHTSTTFKSRVPNVRANDDLDSTDNGSETSDPTELFHRDVGVQTSPLRSRSSSTLSSQDPETSPLEKQATKLETLRDQISALTLSNKSALESAESLSRKVGEVRSFLEDLRFSSRGAMVDDEMNTVKKEIRSVKGALLSAKNFPTGRLFVDPAQNGSDTGNPLRSSALPTS